MLKSCFVWVLAAGFSAVLYAQTPVHIENLATFRSPSKNWQIVGSVLGSPESISLTHGPGAGILLNEPVGKPYNPADNLITNREHGDIHLETDFMLPKRSNSGIYFQGRYEVQLFDSWGVKSPTYIDCGAIYERWDEGRGSGKEGFEGSAPRVNAARPPGQWQHLEVDFEAPRFDSSGQKIRNARFVRVFLNGTLIQQDVLVSGPTRSAMTNSEAPEGPLMIQGDHGAVAFRNITYTLKK